MAEVQTIEEEFLTCSICMQIYTDPCTLTCGHSHCRKCVTKFIKTRPDAVQAKTIPCAFCRQVTPVPRPGRPVEEWAGQIRPSLILQGLMDRHHSGHKHQEGQAICFLCKEVGETIPAYSWCSDCEITLCRRCTKMHHKAPFSKNHNVLELSEGPNVKQRKVKCKEHEGELVKYICNDCNRVACQICCIFEHRACDHVVSIEFMVPDIKSALIEQRRLIKKKLKQTSGQFPIEMYQQHSEFIDQALQSESEVDMYHMYQICVSGAVDSVGDTEPGASNTPVVGELKFTPSMGQLKKAIKDMGTESDPTDTPVVGEVKLSPNTELENAITQIGKLHVSLLRRRKHGPGISLKPVLDDITDIKHKIDSASPGPIDVTVLTVNLTNIMVVADCNNKSLKSVFVTNGRKDIRVLKLLSNPLRLAKMRGNKVAATAENSRIVVAEARPELVLISDIRTKKNYHGITALSDCMLVVGSFTPPVIDILNLRGDVLKSFTPRNTGLDLIQNPHFLSTTPDDNILVSDCYSKSVYCLTPEGEIVFTYTPKDVAALEYPRGITVTNTGDVLLADWGSKKIVQLTLDGTFVRDILTYADGMDMPWGVFVDDNSRLYVCQRAVSSKCVKIFSLTHEKS